MFQNTHHVLSVHLLSMHSNHLRDQQRVETNLKAVVLMAEHLVGRCNKKQTCACKSIQDINMDGLVLAYGKKKPMGP